MHHFDCFLQVKAHYKKSTAVHTFARLMDLLNDSSTTTTSSNNNIAIDGYGDGVGGHDHDLSTRGKHPKVMDVLRSVAAF